MMCNIYKIIRKNLIRYFSICVFFLVFGYIINDIDFSYSYKFYSNHIYNDKYNYPYLDNNVYNDLVYSYISSLDNSYDSVSYDVNIVNDSVNIFFIKYSGNLEEYDSFILFDNRLISLNEYLGTSEDTLLYNIRENIYKEFNISLNDLGLDNINYKIKEDGVLLYIDDIVIYLDNNKLMEDDITNSIVADKFIAFTFDDGPSKYTSKIMDILDNYNFKATFFEVGNMINKYPEVTKEVVSRGYEVGNHTTDHSNLNKLNVTKIKSKVEGNNTIFNELTGENMILVRCPYGNSNKRVRETINNPIIYWSVDSRDWERRNTDKIVNLVKESTRDGDIVLFHDLYSTTMEAVEILTEYFYLNGYKIVSVSELYQIKGKELVSHKVHYNAW